MRLPSTFDHRDPSGPDAFTSDAQLQASTPEVSIIIPAYNSAQYIGDALDSVFAQTFDRYEVIVINDGSQDTEDLERALQRYASDKLHYIKQENRGVAAARNAGLRAARGDLVAFLDADDHYAPTFLQYQVELLRRTNADLVHSDATLFGDPRVQGQTFMKIQRAGGDLTAERLLSVKTSILTTTVLARKGAIMEIGMFDEAFRRAQDFDLWFRMAKAGYRFAYRPDILAHHRIVGSSLSGGTLTSLQRTRTIFEAIKARGGLTPGEAAALEKTLQNTLRQLVVENGKQQLLDRNYDGARKSFDEAQKHRREWKLLLVTLGLIIAPALVCRLYQRRENGLANG